MPHSRTLQDTVLARGALEYPWSPRNEEHGRERATQLDMGETRTTLSCPWTRKRLPRVRGLVPSRGPAALLHVMASGPRKAVAGLVDIERPSLE